MDIADDNGNEVKRKWITSYNYNDQWAETHSRNKRFIEADRPHTEIEISLDA